MPLLEIVRARSAQALGRALQELEKSRGEDSEDGEGRSGDGRVLSYGPPLLLEHPPTAITIMIEPMRGSRSARSSRGHLGH